MKFFYNLHEAKNFHNEHSFIVIYRNVHFPIYLDFKGSDKWIVFTPGACSRQKPMPIFQRSSYSKFIEPNVISLFDPGILFHRKLTNTWFCGTKSRYYGEYIAQILKLFFEKERVNNKKILLFGTSAGGIPALKIAEKLNGCNVLVGNIQIDASIHPAFDKMLPVLFPGLDSIDCKHQFHERFDARSVDSSFRLFYIQNIEDTFHYKNHFKPYREWCLSKEISFDASFYEYDNLEAGHGSVGREKELSIIESIFENENLNLNWLDRLGC